MVVVVEVVVIVVVVVVVVVVISVKKNVIRFCWKDIYFRLKWPSVEAFWQL